MKRLTESVKARLPVYLHYLKSLPSDDKTTISSASIAEGLGLGEVQVRKDLARVSGAGKPKIGYYLGELTEHIENALGIKPETTNAVIVCNFTGRQKNAVLCLCGGGVFNAFRLKKQILSLVCSDFIPFYDKTISDFIPFMNIAKRLFVKSRLV